MTMERIYSIFKEGGKAKDACYHKVRAKYAVWPSAYASGALVQCRKKGASNWGNKTESKKSGGIFSKEKEQGLHGWFSRNNGKGWVNCKTGGPCGREDSSKGSYPACRPTLSACKKFKKPSGKTSKERYSWKRKD